MYRRSLLRASLLLVIVAFLLAIFWSLYTRQQDRAPQARVPVLPETVKKKTTDFEYSEYEGDVSIFRVSARSAVLTSTDVYRLEDVHLVLHPEDAGRDEVRGQEATYSLAEKTILFSGDVETQLEDGSSIFSKQVHGDLDGGLVSIEDGFRIENGSVRGSGKRLVYRVSDRETQIFGNFGLQMPAGDETIRYESEKAVYNLVQKTLDLEGGARIWKGSQYLRAGRIKVSLSEEGRVTLVDAEREAEISLDGGHRFVGGKMALDFDDETGHPTMLRVESGASVSDLPGPVRAVYEERQPEGLRRVEAGVIMARPARLFEPGVFAVEELKAHEDVLLQSQPDRIQQARGRWLELRFDVEQVLRFFDLNGRAQVLRWSQTREDRVEESINASRVQLWFDSLSRPERLSGEKTVQLSMQSQKGKETAFFGDGLEVFYQDGFASRLVGTGGVAFESRKKGDSQKAQLRSETLNVQFEDGELKEVQASGSAEFFQAGEFSEHLAKGEELFLFYEGLRPRRAVIDQAVYLEERQEDQIREVRSEHAEFDLSSGTIQVGGPESSQLVLKSRDQAKVQVGSQTEAGQFLFDQRSGAVGAKGNVRTELQSSRPPIVIQAQRMRSVPEDNSLVFEGRAHLVDGEGSLSADAMEWNLGDETLTFKGQVEGIFNSSGESLESAGYTIRAQGGNWKTSSGVSEYEGDVQFVSDEFEVRASHLELEPGTDASGAIRQKIQAWGEVQIQDAWHTASGDRAQFFPDQGKVIVTGPQAMVVDSEGSTARGSRLTLFFGRREIQVDGQ